MSERETERGICYGGERRYQNKSGKERFSMISNKNANKFLQLEEVLERDAV
jgi:hypothetical protein